MKRRATALGLALLLTVFSLALAQDKADLAAVSRIKDEGLNRSQVMEILSYLSDVYAPRLAGPSPIKRRAENWVMAKLKEWGLQNVHTENFDFGRGWELKKFDAHMIAPVYAPLLAFPKAWTPGTQGDVRGEAVRVDIASEADMERYRGRLKGRFVLTQPAADIEPHFTADAHRYTDEELQEIAKAPEPSRGRRRYGGPRMSRELQRKIMEFYVEEGIAALLEPARGDDGTIFVSSGGERGEDAPPVAPQVAVAAEHYNRLCRILDRDEKVELEMEIQTEFFDQDLYDHNVIAEIPGTDKKDEIVMLGGHLDTWHSGTGATDDGAGCAVALEAVRILQAAGLEPRRTVRIALWGGEEEGLLGSSAYVDRHFASRPGRPSEGGGEAYRSRMEIPLTLKPEHAKLDAYFNFDNGGGRIRGIYLQSNDQVRPVFEAWLEPFRDMGVTTLSIRNTGGTDHLSFDAVGLPGFQFIQDPLDYMSRTHHSSMDLYDRILPADVMQAAVVMASYVYHTAMRDEMLPRKPLVQPDGRGPGGRP